MGRYIRFNQEFNNFSRKTILRFRNAPVLNHGVFLASKTKAFVGTSNGPIELLTTENVTSSSVYRTVSGNWTIVSENYGDEYQRQQTVSVTGFESSKNIRIVWIHFVGTVRINEEITHTGSVGGVGFGNVTFGNVVARTTLRNEYVDGSSGNTTRTWNIDFQNFCGDSESETGFFPGASTITISCSALNLRRCTAYLSWSAQIFGIS